jgi:hypothetical protein
MLIFAVLDSHLVRVKIYCKIMRIFYLKKSRYLSVEWYMFLLTPWILIVARKLNKNLVTFGFFFYVLMVHLRLAEIYSENDFSSDNITL